MVELVVVVAVMCVLAAIFLPKWVKQQARNSSRISCSNNLKMIGLAFKTWSLDSADDYPAVFDERRNHGTGRRRQRLATLPRHVQRIDQSQDRLLPRGI